MNAWRADRQKHYSDMQQSWRDRNPVRVMWQKARHRAFLNDIQFSLTLRDMPLIPEFCPVLGLKLYVVSGKTTDNSPTLDRIHNHLGYVPGNVIVVSLRANRLKSDASIDELIRMAHFYSQFR
jgi:hypothetical protein